MSDKPYAASSALQFVNVHNIIFSGVRNTNFIFQYNDLNNAVLAKEQVLSLIMRCIPRIPASVVLSLVAVCRAQTMPAQTQPAQTQPAPPLRVSNEKASGTYAINELIRWRVEYAGTQPITSIHFVVKRCQLTVVQSGDLQLTGTEAELETKLDRPGTLLVEFSVPGMKDASGKPISALGGALVAPEQIATSAAAPADFDEFWKNKVDEVSQIPLNPVLTEAPAERSGCSYWKVTLDNVHGTHVQGQLARPTAGKKFPAVLLLQYAGVYGLKKPWVTDYARKGYLAFNIEAHDIPIDESADFYQHLMKTTLAGYVAMGIEDRETYYFLRMFQGCYQAARYLKQRPDWDGKILVVTGGSQGGMQTLATAALVPGLTAAMATVPAGCDVTGKDADRAPGWPIWPFSGGALGKTDPAKAIATLRYFDGVNFAAKIRCPLLVAVGLVDETVPATGPVVAFNQAKVPKYLLVMPRSDHRGSNNTAAPYWSMSLAWLEALKTGKPVPIEPSPPTTAP